MKERLEKANRYQNRTRSPEQKEKQNTKHGQINKEKEIEDHSCYELRGEKKRNDNRTRRTAQQKQNLVTGRRQSKKQRKNSGKRK